jgi:hypothetical protein
MSGTVGHTIDKTKIQFSVIPVLLNSPKLPKPETDKRTEKDVAVKLECSAYLIHNKTKYYRNNDSCNKLVFVPVTFQPDFFRKTIDAMI